MRSLMTAPSMLAAALACVGAGCATGGEPGTAPAACQAALDHMAACTGSEPIVFAGECDEEMAASADEVLALGCDEVDEPKADGAYCAELLARLGLCGGGSPTLGPWGLRVTRIVATDSRCRRQGADLLEPGLELRNATSQEKCLETAEFRPTIDLGAEETYVDAGVPDPLAERDAVLSGYGLEDVADSLILANVGHVDGEFTVARIPYAAFETAQAFYLIETFELRAIRGSHGMVRVRFAGPVVELYPQYPPSGAPVATTQEIVLSVHATAVRGGSYDPLGAGMHDGMALARGVFSIEQKIQDVLLRRGHTVDQYVLSMTGDDIRRFVVTYAGGSPDRVFTTSYHTLRRNCGTEILQVFADAFPERGYAPPESFDNTPFLQVIGDALDGRLLPDIIPERVRPALERRGLYGGPAEPWATDPTIQETVERLDGSR